MNVCSLVKANQYFYVSMNVCNLLKKTQNTVYSKKTLSAVDSKKHTKFPTNEKNAVWDNGTSNRFVIPANFPLNLIKIHSEIFNLSNSATSATPNRDID